MSDPSNLGPVSPFCVGPAKTNTFWLLFATSVRRHGLARLVITLEISTQHREELNTNFCGDTRTSNIETTSSWYIIMIYKLKSVVIALSVGKLWLIFLIESNDWKPSDKKNLIGFAGWGAGTVAVSYSQSELAKPTDVNTSELCTYIHMADLFLIWHCEQGTEQYVYRP